MDGDEWEILEATGAFHFTFSLVPMQWYDLQPKPIQTTRTEHGSVIQIWWQTQQPAISIRDYFDDCLIRSDGSPLEFILLETVWTDESHHRVELWETEHNEVEDLLIQIDTRYPYVDFLSSVVIFANQSRCLFYLEHEDDFVEATSIAIFEALSRSPAAALEKRRFDRPRNQ